MTPEQRHVIAELPGELEKLEELQGFMETFWGDPLWEPLVVKARQVWRFGFRARDVLATVPASERSNSEYVAAMKVLDKYLEIQKAMYAEDDRHNPNPQ